MTNDELELLVKDRIRARRIALGLSQEELGQRLGSKPGSGRSYVSQLETGARSLTVGQLAKVAEALETHAAVLVAEMVPIKTARKNAHAVA